ncbi:hypothetical protein LOC68_18885 [Blastopirellula sp. JC732]|uniref:Uncharacterized protein n=1 Tax=Blastopirellula sediminis TaxID=2894196 RepID=A0A9X1MPQ5_9BACT|nr:hypothetical protein [Blastopirellula sediminis]MCC9606236.1 hypothetical protein [Blastopirellula sediminis]MCC9630466.1 hypothetical protein [Blastopirellula sediminis]
MNEHPRKPLKSGDVYSAEILRDEYGMNAANRPYFTIDPAEVPEHLRDLIPYAERWAISCDVTRGDYRDQQPEEDIAAFYYDVLPYIEQINEWLDSNPRAGDFTIPLPDAEYHFLILLKAHAEAYQPTEEDIRRREEQWAIWRRQREREKALAAVDDAFRAKDYQQVVRLLTPYEEDLDKVLTAKLNLARKRAQ